MTERRLYRSKENRVLFGVCGGIGEYFDVDPTIIRIIFVLFSIWGGIGIVLYIVGLIVIPESRDKKEENFAKVSDKGKTDEDQCCGHHGRSHEYVIGLFIILLGLYFLFRNFLPWLSFQLFWPALLIFVGLLLIFSSVKKGGK
jgi:phage shock protein PspC (stress-responsive transcriptional regulator)